MGGAPWRLYVEVDVDLQAVMATTTATNKQYILSQAEQTAQQKSENPTSPTIGSGYLNLRWLVLNIRILAAWKIASATQWSQQQAESKKVLEARGQAIAQAWLRQRGGWACKAVKRRSPTASQPMLADWCADNCRRTRPSRYRK
jgi:hypothetical protein